MASVYRTYRKDGTPHPCWKYEYRDYEGRQRRGTGTASKRETLQIAQKIHAEHRAMRKGLAPKPTPAATDMSFSSAVDEYRKWGETHGGRNGYPWGKTHAQLKRNRLAWWEDKLSFKTLKDLGGCLPRVEKQLGELHKQGRAGKTLRNYAEALLSFCKWCHQRGYMTTKPLDNLTQFSAEPLTERRALTIAEIERLLNAAPPERHMLYKIAICTGLRANELRNLTVNHLDETRCALRLDAKWTKNRRAGYQPLDPALLEELQAFVAEGTAVTAYEKRKHTGDKRISIPEEPLLYVPSHAARAFHKDCAVAGIAKFIPGQGKVDFHALRVVYATLVIESGATLKEAQLLLRHSNPTLTMNIYAKVREGRLNEVAKEVGKAINPTRLTPQTTPKEARQVG